MVLLIVGTVVGALTPSVMRTLSRARVNRSANVVAGDFMLAQSMAGRRRAPVILTFDGTAMTATISLPPPANTVLFTRRFGAESEYKLQTLTASPTSVQVLPNGMANQSVTVTVGSVSYTKQVRMSRAGQVHVL